MLQSQPALHPNQRCGGCATRPAVNLPHKGSPYASPTPPVTAGQYTEAGKWGRQTHRQGPKDPEIQAETHRVGAEGRVRHSALEMKETGTQVSRDTRSGNGDKEAEPEAGERGDKEQKAGDTHKGRHPEARKAGRDGLGERS